MTTSAKDGACAGAGNPPFHSSHRGGGTFHSIYLQPEIYGALPFAELVTEILKRLAAFTPGQINLTIKGSFDGEVTVLVDGAEMARTTGKTIALDNLRVGARKVMARATTGGKPLDASRMIEVKPGTIESLELRF